MLRRRREGTDAQEQLLTACGDGVVMRASEPGQVQAYLRPADLRLAALKAIGCVCLLGLLSAGSVLGARLVLQGGNELSVPLLWVVFLLVAPVTWAAKEAYEELLGLRARACCAMVTLQNTGSKWDRCLMEALAHELRMLKLEGAASQAVVDTGEEDEDGKRKWQVSLRPLASGAKLVLAGGSEILEVVISLQQKDPVVCGRAQELRQPEVAQLWVQTGTIWEFLSCGLNWSGDESARLGAKQQRARALVASWLQASLDRYIKGKVGHVQVYELQEEYKDYRPTWELIREESCTSSSVTGLAHYAEQPWALRVRRQVDYALGHGGKSRLSLFIAGQKGSGKTVFVEWLAGEMRAPVYYIDLRSPTVNDSILRDSVARNRLCHSPPVLFHLDEFQAPLQQWLNSKEGAVSIEGLQCMLEGISTPNNAVFIFTSSMELPPLEEVKDQRVRHELQGLLRRFQGMVAIPALNQQGAEAFLLGFLRGYVEIDDLEFLRRGQGWRAFAAAWQHWSTEVAVPFDMFCKYLEQAVRDFYVDGGWSSSSHRRPGRGPILVQDLPGSTGLSCEAFLEAVLNPKGVASFIRDYAGGAHLSKFQAAQAAPKTTIVVHTGADANPCAGAHPCELLAVQAAP